MVAIVVVVSGGEGIFIWQCALEFLRSLAGSCLFSIDVFIAIVTMIAIEKMLV